MDNSTSKWVDFINTLYPPSQERKDRFAEEYELTHAMLGLAGETGEVIDLIKKNLAYGKELDKEKLTLEMGDLFHYFMRIACLTGLSLDDIIEGNLKKLSARFPNGYTNTDAINKTENKKGQST
jgi:NTP pyrophosphatase (non-canonical NTP hydrolase)